MKDQDHEKYITIYQSMVGWKAVMVWWNDEEKDLPGFWEPYDTWTEAHLNPEDAIQDAIFWAEAEGLKYQPAEIPNKKDKVKKHIQKTNYI